MQQSGNLKRNNNTILTAAKADDWATVNAFAQHAKDPRDLAHFHEALVYATRARQARTVGLLLQAGATAHNYDRNSYPVVTAAKAGDWATVNAFAQHEKDPRDLAHFHEALVYATRARQAHTVGLLLQAGATAHNYDRNSYPVVTAAKADDWATVNAFAQHAKDPRDLAHFHEALVYATRARQARTVGLLLQAGATAHNYDRNSYPVVTAAKAGDWATVNAFAQHEKDPRDLAHFHEALVYATRARQAHTVGLLLQAGATAHNYDRNSYPVVTAAKADDWATVNAFAQHAKDPRDLAHFHEALVYATRARQARTVGLLLQAGATAHNYDRNSYPVVTAAKAGDWATVNAFAQHEKDPWDLAHFHEALVYATRARQVRTVVLLLQAGATTHNYDRNSYPVVTAAKAGDWATVNVFAQHEKDPRHLAHFHEALVYATRARQARTVGLLLQAGATAHNYDRNSYPVVTAAKADDWATVNAFAQHAKDPWDSAHFREALNMLVRAGKVDLVNTFLVKAAVSLRHNYPRDCVRQVVESNNPDMLAVLLPHVRLDCTYMKIMERLAVSQGSHACHEVLLRKEHLIFGSSIERIIAMHSSLPWPKVLIDILVAYAFALDFDPRELPVKIERHHLRNAVESFVGDYRSGSYNSSGLSKVFTSTLRATVDDESKSLEEVSGVVENYAVIAAQQSKPPRALGCLLRSSIFNDKTENNVIRVIANNKAKSTHYKIATLLMLFSCNASALANVDALLRDVEKLDGMALKQVRQFIKQQTGEVISVSGFFSSSLSGEKLTLLKQKFKDAILVVEPQKDNGCLLKSKS